MSPAPNPGETPADRPRPFTGRGRDRRTGRGVKIADTVAGWCITVGGVGTILAIFGVGVVLVAEVFPLFAPASLGTPAPVTEAGAWQRPGSILRIEEFVRLGWSLAPDGTLTVFRADTGRVLRSGPVAESRAGDVPVTAVAAAFDSEDVAVGFADGTVRFGTVGVRSRFLSPDEVTAELRDLEPGSAATFGPRKDAAVVERTVGGPYRVLSLDAQFDDAAVPLTDGPVERLTAAANRDGTVALGWGGGEPRMVSVRRRQNRLTGRLTVTPGDPVTLPRPRDLPGGPPGFLRIGARAAEAFAAWPDGTLVRVDVGNPASATILETVDLLPDAAVAELTALSWVVGRTTLLAGDSTGGLSGWFPARPEGRPSAAPRLVRAHRYDPGPAAVSVVDPSPDDRLAVVGYADGTARVVQTTTESTLAEVSPGGTSGDGPVRAGVLTPREDRRFLLAATGRGLTRTPFEAGHPSATVASLFLPVWYERASAPENTWQSSGAGAGVEPKFGMWPLVFGTLKGTFYSMLLATPLALLAAIYTSEYLHRDVRSRVKPAVEIMAGLPSVVLGFLAAVVFAPFAEDWLVAVLTSFVTVPLCLLAAAYLWQLLPQQVTLGRGRWRLPLCVAVLPVGATLAVLLAPAVERLLFAGDVVRWLGRKEGSPTGAWMLFLTPVSALCTAIGSAYVLRPALVRRGGWTRGRFAGVDAVRFLFLAAVALGAAWSVSAGLATLGYDPRETSWLGRYDQRNALVVGFAMGFAIIPIIYTLADDALSSVPDSLRSASLGAGATPWQTAVRVVVPAAMSGLFSAVMVGLGRAVGETMIVLMATGNTPVTDWNPFNGFRTLSANIATEIPEAVKGSTHFRTLFLAALILFGLTFLVNTAAELVRLRFRKRVSQI